MHAYTIQQYAIYNTLDSCSFILSAAGSQQKVVMGEEMRSRPAAEAVTLLIATLLITDEGARWGLAGGSNGVQKRLKQGSKGIIYLTLGFARELGSA